MYVPSQITPPLPFPAGSFDLVYGVSVFTHLREPLQLRWLDELARVTVPGAYVLATVHGSTAIEFAGLAADDALRLEAEVQRSGLLAGGANSQIDGYADHGGEYVNVFHSQDYIRRVWSKYFEVLDILPGYIFTHDLVVLHKP